MARHELKTWPLYFHPVWDGFKRFEIRENDRGFANGDELLLREYGCEPEDYTGRAIFCRVTYMLPGGVFRIDPRMCVMSFKVLAHLENAYPQGHPKCGIPM